MKNALPALRRRLWTKGVWSFTVAGACLLLASVFVAFRLGRAQQIAGIAAFVFLGLGVALRATEEVEPARSWALRWWAGRGARRLFVALAIGLIVSESLFLVLQRGAPPPAAVETVSEVASEDIVQFAGALALAKRYGVDESLPPFLRATVDEPLERAVPFTAPKTGAYRLAVQMTDSPFVDSAQRESDYFTIVDAGRTTGQTFRVSDRVTRLSSIRVKLEARSLPNNLPATTLPDAPLALSLRPVGPGAESAAVVEVRLPPEEAGLNDAWRWVAFPLDMDLSEGTPRTFLAEFTSSSSVIGWALSHVTSGFRGTDDFYTDGELFVNRAVYTLGGDLSFEVLGRNEQSASPEVIVDETPLALVPSDDDAAWQVSQPISLQEEVAHSLTVRSRNPHIGFYRFVFVQEQAPVEPSPPTERPKETSP